MKNVYQERLDRNLYAIISNTYKDNIPDNILKQAAIIIYVYYDTSINDYFNYINDIPKVIDTYIISSNELLLKEARIRFSNRENIFFIVKPNIGRDVSALLVTAKSYIMQYKYICFVHDKKEKHKDEKKAVSSWIENMWINTIGDENHIINTISYLYKNDKIGILTPMEPIEFFEEDFWSEDYDNTVKLATELGLESTDISKKYQPIALGTCIWAKTEALRKIFMFDWKYSDFVSEPMPDDGTISHAIERIIPFVAQDAGYFTGVIISEKYASNIIARLYDNWYEMGSFIKEKVGISNLEELKRYKNDDKYYDIINYCKSHDLLYIYGAGIKAKRVKRFLENYNINISGFIVTDISAQNCNSIEGITVMQADKVELINSGVVIATNIEYYDEIMETLYNLGYTKPYYFEI